MATDPNQPTTDELARCLEKVADTNTDLYHEEAHYLRLAATRIREQDKALKACKPLVDACHEEFVGDVCANEPDDEPVAKGEDTASPITFGMIYAARRAVEEAANG